jgi:hypothetical protein
MKMMKMKRDEPLPKPNEGARKMKRSGNPQPITIQNQ